MGKKNKGRNRGSLGEDFEDSYEYDAEDNDYQDYGKKRNKRRNRDSNNNYDGYGYSGYDSEEDDDQDQDDYGVEEDYDQEDDEYERDDADSYSSDDTSEYGRSHASYSSATQNSSTVSSSVFKESKPSPLSGMHHVKATPNSGGFVSRTATPYDSGVREEVAQDKQAGSFGFKRVSVTPDAHSTKQRDEVEAGGDSDQDRGDEPYSPPKKWGFSGFFNRRNNNEDVDGSQDQATDSSSERKGLSKSQESDRRDYRSNEDPNDASEDDQLKEIRISEIHERLDKIEADIQEYQQFTGSDDEILEAKSSIEKLKEERKSLKSELRELTGSRLAFLSGFSTAALTSSVKAVGKKISTPFSALRRRALERGDDEEDSDRSDRSSSEDREAARQERRDEKLRRREEKKLQQERKKEERKARRAAREQGANDDQQQDESVVESDGSPSPNRRRWTVLVHRTLGVTIVATVLLVGGYVAYMFLGSENGKKQTTSAVAQTVGLDSKSVGNPSTLSGKYASKTSAEGGEKLLPDSSGRSKGSKIAKSEATEKEGWWSRLKSKFSRKNQTSNIAKKSDEKKDKGAKFSKNDGKLSEIGKSASGSLKKTAEAGKSGLDSFNEKLMSESDALKRDLDDVNAAFSKKTDELGEELSSFTDSVSDQLTDAADSFKENVTDLAHSAEDGLSGLGASFESATEDLVGTVSDPVGVSENAVPESDAQLASEDVPPVSQPETDDESVPTSVPSFESPDDLLAVEDEEIPLNDDPEEAKFTFGETPVRTPSDSVIPSSSGTPTVVDELDNETSSAALLGDSDAPVGAEWSASESANSTSQSASSTSIAESAPLDTTSANLNSQSDVSLGTSLPSATVSTPSLLDSEVADATPSLTNSGAPDVTSSLPTLSTPSSTDEGMSLSVDDASNPTLELDETSDMNTLSGAAPVVRDDFDTWNTTPSLTTRGNAAPENSLATSLNNLNTRVGSIADRVTEESQNFRDAAVNSLDSLGASLNEGVTNLQNRGQQALNSIDDAVSGVRNAYDNSVENIQQSVGALTNSLDNVRQSTSETLQNVGDNISNNFNTLQRQFNDVNGSNALTNPNSLSNASTSPSVLSSSGGTNVSSPLSTPRIASQPTTSNATIGASTEQNLAPSSLVQGNAPQPNALQTTPATSALNSAPVSSSHATPQLATNPSVNSPAPSISSPSSTTLTSNLMPTQLGANPGGNAVASVPSTNITPTTTNLATPQVGVAPVPNVMSTPSVAASPQTVAPVVNAPAPTSVAPAYSTAQMGNINTGTQMNSSTIAPPAFTDGTYVPSTAMGTPVVAPVTTSVPIGAVGATDAPAGYRQYVTKEGDNLLTIAARELGSSSRWGEIKRLNNLRSGATYFEAGTRLLLPTTTSTSGN